MRSCRTRTPGYIDLDQFERNQRQLRRSALAYGLENRRSPPREGPALLQGLVVCGVCGGRMTVRYHQRGEHLVPDYQCITGRRHQRQPLCQVIPGTSIDRAVGERLAASMTTTAIELSLSVRAELQTRIDEADRLRMQQVERAEHDVRLAQRRYMQVDPDNRLVAGTLEADWNQKLRVLAQARDESERQRAADRSTLDEAMHARIRALADDFPAIWNNPGTSHRDKKRMAQLLLEDVTLLKSDRLHVHLRFKGGAVESLALPLPENAWTKRLTHAEVVARVEQLLEQHDEEEVVEQLNSEGLRTGAGRPFDKEAVRWVRYTHGLKRPQDILRESGRLTVRETSALLGLSEATVRAWARNGSLQARLTGRKATWLIDPIEQQSDEIRQLAKRAEPRHSQERLTAPTALYSRIEALLLDGHHNAVIAEHLNAEGWSPPTGASFDAVSVRQLRKHRGLRSARTQLREAGMLTTPEIAVLLGIGLKTIGNWARAGRLHARRCGDGSRPAWLFDPVDQQPPPVRQLAAKRLTMPKHRGLLSDAAAGQGAV